MRRRSEGFSSSQSVVRRLCAGGRCGATRNNSSASTRIADRREWLLPAVVRRGSCDLFLLLNDLGGGLPSGCSAGGIHGVGGFSISVAALAKTGHHPDVRDCAVWSDLVSLPF